MVAANINTSASSNQEYLYRVEQSPAGLRRRQEILPKRIPDCHRNGAL